MITQLIGLGNSQATLRVYIENRPPLPHYENLNTLISLPVGEIKAIATQTGNHWRKIFNVYAKLLFALFTEKSNDESYENCTTWQQLRDEKLLQSHDHNCLLFSPPEFDVEQENSSNNANDTIHLVMGRTYAKKLGLSESCFWLSTDFAINKTKRLIICPYFDYRQLSNIKIQQLVTLINSLSTSH